MSRETKQAVEDAIVAHLRDEAKGDADKDAVVIDWVVGVTLSKIDDENDVVYRNGMFAPNNNPNGQIGLTAWMSTEIAEAMEWDGE